MTPSCPDPEVLAALADQRTPLPARAPLLAHIAECADCYVVFVETARLVEAAPRAVAPPSGRHVLAGLAAAAAAILAFAVQRPGAPAPEPAGSRVAVRDPASTAPRPRAVSHSALPAWMSDAPWRGPGSHSGFGPPSPHQQALLLGMHLAALERACREADPGVRELAAHEVAASVEATGLLSSEALDSRCPGSLPVEDPAVADWRTLGHALESWRIAVVERDPSALEGARSRELERLAGRIRLEPPARALVGRLVAIPDRGGSAPWGGLAATLGELIELLCA